MALNKFVIDIGAGLYKQYPEYLIANQKLILVAFEPHQELYHKITKLKDQWNNNEHIAYNKHNQFYVYNIAISDENKENAPFYEFNDPVASSLANLNINGAREWKYPFQRKRFAINQTTHIKQLTLAKFLEKNKPLKKKTIDLLNIDIQGTPHKVLNGITKEMFKKIKRIVVKCIDVPFELYENQSNVIQIIDKLKVHNFTLVRGFKKSHDQEQILEFANKLFNFSPSEISLPPPHTPHANVIIHPISRLTDNGDMIVNI